MRTRVLHVCSDTNIGGAGRYVLTLLTEPTLTEQYEVAVACPEGALADSLRQAGVSVMTYPGADRSFSWGAFKTLFGLVRRWRPQIVHTHGALAGRLAGGLAGARVIFTKHGLAAGSERSVQVRSPGGLARQAAVRLFADRIVAVSDAVKRALVAAGADPGAIRVIPGGIALAQYAAVPPAVPGVIGAVGRLEREKGFDVLVQAMDRLRGEARLLIGGDGMQRAALTEQVQGLGLNDVISLTGFVSEMPAFLGQIGLFVSSSRTEGLGLVLLEAMAAGRPVVATRVGGVPEVVADGETGILVEPENPEALAGAMKRLLSDPGLAARMSEAGRRRVEQQFSSRRMAEQTAALYRELVGS
ncbi:MAG: glycosyltransferase family 4 protein [Mycobacterium leprae]